MPDVYEMQGADDWLQVCLSLEHLGVASFVSAKKSVVPMFKKSSGQWFSCTA